MDTDGLRRPPIPHGSPRIPHDIPGVGNVVGVAHCPSALSTLDWGDQGTLRILEATVRLQLRY